MLNDAQAKAKAKQNALAVVTQRMKEFNAGSVVGFVLITFTAYREEILSGEFTHVSPEVTLERILLSLDETRLKLLMTKMSKDLEFRAMIREIVRENDEW